MNDQRKTYEHKIQVLEEEMMLLENGNLEKEAIIDAILMYQDKINALEKPDKEFESDKSSNYPIQDSDEEWIAINWGEYL